MDPKVDINMDPITTPTHTVRTYKYMEILGIICGIVACVLVFAWPSLFFIALALGCIAIVLCAMTMRHMAGSNSTLCILGLTMGIVAILPAAYLSLMYTLVLVGLRCDGC